MSMHVQPQHPYNESMIVASTFNTPPGEAKAGGPLNFTGQPA